MNIRSALLLSAVILIQLGASAPTQSKSGTSQKSKRGHSALGPQGVVSDSVVNFFSPKKTGKDLMSQKNSNGDKGPVDGQSYSAAQGAAAAPASRGVVISTPVAAGRAAAMTMAVAAPAYRPAPAVARAVNSAVVPTAFTLPTAPRIQTLAVPPPPAARVAVPEIRKEIQKILELNKQIKAVQGGRSGQFERVQEQALIHGKVLDKMEASPEGESELSTDKSASRDDLIAQEKLRIIHEEAQRNNALLEAVGRESSSATRAPASGSKPQPQKT